MYKIEIFNNNNILQAVICIKEDNMGYVMINEENISLEMMLDIIMEQEYLTLKFVSTDVIYEENIVITDVKYYDAIQYNLRNYSCNKINTDDTSIENVLSAYLEVE